MADETSAKPAAGRLQILRDTVAPSIWPLADQAMVSVSNFLTNILIARGLGVYEFGLFTLAWTAVLFAAAVQNALINAPMYSFSPRQEPSERASYFGALIAQGVALAVAMAAIVLICARGGALAFGDWAFEAHAVPLAAATGFYLLQDFFRRCLFARERRRAAFVSDAISYVGQIAALIVAFQMDIGLGAVFWINAITSALAALVGFAAIGPLEWHPEKLRSIMARHWHFSRWLFGSLLVQSASNYTFLLITGAVLGAVAVGGMRAASLVLAVGNVFNLGLENILPLRAADVLHRQGLAAFKSFMRIWTAISFAIGLSIALAAAAAPSFWIKLLFGTQMIGYADFIYGFAIGCPLIFLTSMAGIVLRTGDATLRLFRVGAVVAMLGVASAYPLIHAFGLWGSVGGTVLCQIVGLAMLAVSAKRTIASIAEKAAARPAAHPDPRSPESAAV